MLPSVFNKSFCGQPKLGGLIHIKSEHIYKVSSGSGEWPLNFKIMLLPVVKNVDDLESYLTSTI